MRNIQFNCCLLILFLGGNFLFAQSDKELVFNVVKTNVQLKPNYEFLIHNLPHKISIVSKNKNAKTKLVLAGGSVLIRDKDTVLIAENLNGNGVLLKVYETSAGEDKLLITKNYEVIDPPELYIGETKIGVTEFETLDTNFFYQKLEVRAKYKNTFIPFNLLSYHFSMTCKGDFRARKIRENKLPKIAIKEMCDCYEPNFKVYFDQITFQLVTGETQMTGYSIIKFK